MQLFIIALRDLKADLFKPPMFVNNINVAIRDLRDMINEPETDGRPKQDWQRHPEDFELMHLGSWETDNGQFEILPHKQLLALSTLKG